MTPKISLVAVCCSKRLLEFVEQPHVLDGDDRLVGEGFEEFDLRRSEWAHLGATRDQRSNEILPSDEGERLRACARLRRNPHLEIHSARGCPEREARHARASSDKLWRINIDLDVRDGR